MMTKQFAAKMLHWLAYGVNKPDKDLGNLQLVHSVLSPRLASVIPKL